MLSVPARKLMEKRPFVVVRNFCKVTGLYVWELAFTVVDEAKS